jgi:hypothetical protein
MFWRIQTWIFWALPQYFGPYPNILGPTSKFKIPHPRLFSPGPKVSKKVCHTSVGQKLREEIDFLETGHFQPSAVPLRLADVTPPAQKLLAGSWTGNKNFIKILSFHQKSFNYLNRKDTQTNRQTHDLPSTYGWVKSFMPFFDTFHFTMFASLTPFVKDE